MPVERHRDRAPRFDVIEGRLPVDGDGDGDIERHRFADRLRCLAVNVLQERHGDLVREGHVEGAGDKAEHCRRAVRYNRVFDGVEMGQARLPVIRVALEFQRLVWLVVDKFEWPGADRMRTHLARRDAAGVDRRVSRSEQREKRRLRPLHVEGRFVLALGRDIGEVEIPGLTRVEPQLLLAAAEQQIPGAFDIGGSEGFPVMPFDIAAQFERQLGAVLIPAPARCQFGPNRREAVLSDVLVIEHEVIKDAHHRHDRRPGRLLMDRHRGRAVPVIDPQGATRLLSRGGSRGAERKQQPEAHR